MTGTYSADLRERVVAAITNGMSRRAASRLFKVSASSVIRWMQSFNERGSCEAKPTGGDVRSQAMEAHKDWLLSLIDQEPDLTLEEIRARLAVEQAFKASVSMLWRFFHRHRISFKRTLHAAEQDRPAAVASERRERREEQPTIDPRRLVFIDETWASTNMTRLRRRARIDQPLIGKAPQAMGRPRPLSPFCAVMPSPPRWSSPGR